MRRLVAVAANTFRESVRERVLYNLVFFAILMMASGVLLRDLSVRQEHKIVKDVGLASMEVFGILIALFLGVALLTRDIERRSLYPLLAKPLTRDELLVGKFLGLVFTLLVNTAVMTVGLFATQWLLSGAIEPRLMLAVYGIVLMLIMVTAIAVLLSMLTSPIIALIGTIGVVLAGRMSDVVREARQVMPDVPEWVITVIFHTIPNFRALDVKEAVVYGDPVGGMQLLYMTAYAGVYTSIVLFLAIWAFRRRELT
jgi:Cu-processing system permease protein